MLGARLRDDGRIEVPGGLRLTLQRAFPEDWKAGGRVPRSYGRLPFVLAPKEAGFAIPILPDEIVWIGLEAPPFQAIAQLKVTFSDGMRSFNLQCPPDFAIAAVYAGKEARPIMASDTLRISVRSGRDDIPHCVLLWAFPAEQVLPSGWQEAHRQLERSRGYSGERLP